MSLPPKGKGECLLFGHADVSAVEKLGGKCYRVNRVPGKGGKKSKGNVNQLQDGHLVHMSVLEVEGFSVLPNTFASLLLVNVMHGKLGDKQQRCEGHAENVMPNLIKAVERGKMNGGLASSSGR